MGLTYEPGCVAILRSLPPGPKKAARAALDRLAEDPRASGLDWKRMQTSRSDDLLYRLRIGEYRVAYVLRGRDIRVVRAFHRREGYRWLARLGF